MVLLNMLSQEASVNAINGMAKYNFLMLFDLLPKGKKSLQTAYLEVL